MQKITDISSGIYVLEIYAPSPFEVAIKKFSEVHFPKGYYYYIGSAQKNLGHRINRHLKLNKKLHWHIDYITSNIKINIKSILIFKDFPRDFECKLTGELQDQFSLIHIAKGFGNSDCNICESHLLYSKKLIDYNHLLSLYQSTVRLIPSSRETF